MSANMTMILTDEEIIAAANATGASSLLIRIARRIETAVLEKLRQQEPAAFAILSDSGNAVRIWWSGAERERAERIAAEDFHGMPLVALYASPVPATVSEGWKLVPVEPTEEWMSALGEKGVRVGSIKSAITDVLSAAPAAPAVPAGLVQVMWDSSIRASN